MSRETEKEVHLAISQKTSLSLTKFNDDPLTCNSCCMGRRNEMCMKFLD